MFDERQTKMYLTLVQKTQAGIKTLADLGDSKLYEPKHLRVGINNLLVEHSALVRLLVSKGILTWDEVATNLIEAYEKEIADLEERIFQVTGFPVKLDVPPDFAEKLERMYGGDSQG